MSKSKRFQKTRIVDEWGGIYDSKTDEILKINDITNKLNELSYENEQLEKGKMEALSLLGEEIDKNEQLRQTMQKVCELLEEEVDLFSDEATEHDIIAYSEMQKFDNKDTYYICTATKKAIQMLKGRE